MGRGVWGRVRDQVGSLRQDEAARIAEGVRETALAIRGVASVGLAVQAPAQFAAEQAAVAMIRQYGLAKLDEDPAELAAELAAYLTYGFLAMIAEFNEEHFRRWKEEADELERGLGAAGR